MVFNVKFLENPDIHHVNWDQTFEMLTRSYSSAQKSNQNHLNYMHYKMLLDKMRDIFHGMNATQQIAFFIVTCHVFFWKN